MHCLLLQFIAFHDVNSSQFIFHPVDDITLFLAWYFMNSRIFYCQCSVSRLVFYEWEFFCVCVFVSV